MNTINFRLVILTVVVTLVVVVMLRKATASPNQQVVENVALTMYALSNTGDNTKTLCNDENKLLFGCTAKPNDFTYAYPFASSVITIGIESDTSTGSQQGYLHNVVSQEMIEGATLSAYTAQAIAARTYTYDHIRRNIPLNNSNSFHVYMPFRHAILANADRRIKVSNAISRSNQLYLTVPLTTTALDARYGADNCTYTQQGYVDAEKTTKVAYLRSIFDPISGAANPDPCQNDATTFGTGNGGMSSAGASRWGFGNTNAYNLGDKWPVQWGEEPGTIDGDSWRNSFQILTHYYTGVHIQDRFGFVRTPDLRWNALDVRWNGSITPPKFTPGSTSQTKQATITLQNTGTDHWTTTTTRRYYLAYRWNTNRQTGRVENEVQIAATSPISIGNDLAITLQVDAPSSVFGATEYTLSIDMFYRNNNGSLVAFSTADALNSWFTHDITFEVDNTVICPQQVGGCGGSSERYSYLPIIMKPGDIPPRPDPTATQPTSSGACQAGRLLFRDSFEDGNPFKPPSDDDDDDFGFDPRLQGAVSPFGQVRTGQKSDIDNPDSLVDSGQWTIHGYNSYTVPAKVNLEDKNNTNEGGENEDGVRLGGKNDKDNDGRGDVDQLMTIAVPMYAGTKKLRLTFDALLESDHPSTAGGSDTSFDHFYASLKTSKNESDDNLAPPYECNEDVALDHVRCWDETWVRTEYDIELDQTWGSTSDDQVYLHFWTDVDHNYRSTFYLDNLELTIQACE